MADNDKKYKAWEKMVNKIIARRIWDALPIGTGSSYWMGDLHDMPDVSPRDLFDEGVGPKEAASEIMQRWIDEGDMPEELL